MNRRIVTGERTAISSKRKENVIWGFSHAAIMVCYGRQGKLGATAFIQKIRKYSEYMQREIFITYITIYSILISNSYSCRPK